jgi:hypothetical protein
MNHQAAPGGRSPTNTTPLAREPKENRFMNTPHNRKDNPA